MDFVSLTPLRDRELTHSALTGSKVFSPGYDQIGEVRGVEGRGSKAVALGKSSMASQRYISLPLSTLNFMRDRTQKVHATAHFNAKRLSRSAKAAAA